MTASVLIALPSDHARPSRVIRSNWGSAVNAPRYRASRTAGTMTMSPSPPMPGSSRPSAMTAILRRAVANGTRPSTSSGRNRGSRCVTQMASVTEGISARICAAELLPPNTATREPSKRLGRRSPQRGAVVRRSRPCRDSSARTVAPTCRCSRRRSGSKGAVPGSHDQRFGSVVGILDGRTRWGRCTCSSYRSSSRVR